MTHLLPLFSELAAWWLALAAFALAAAPLAVRWLGGWPGAAAALARPLGLLAGALVFWFGNALGLLGRGMPSALAALGAVVALGWGAAVTRAGREHLRALGGWTRRERGALLAGEALFLVALLGWASVRAAIPTIRHTEQPADLMLLNAVSEGVGFPPEDPWLAGEPIAYHDLGAWMVVLLARLAASPISHAFNLAQAAWLAMLSGAAFGLGDGLLRRAKGEGTGDGGAASARGSGWAGLLAATSVALLGNLAVWTVPGSPLAGVALSGASGGSGPWWWGPSRAIFDRDASGQSVEVITEFPAFSYLLGDLHAHLLAGPFWLLAVALALAPCFGSNGGSTGSTGARTSRALALALVSGAFLALDPWELPGLGLLLVGAGALAAPGGSVRGRLVGAARGAAIWGCGLLPFLPLRASAASQVSGLLANLRNPTSLGEMGVVAGAFAPGIALLLASAARQVRPTRRALALALGLPVAALAALLGGTALVLDGASALAETTATWAGELAVAPLLAAALGLALLLLLSGERLAPAQRVPLALAGLGLALLLVPEIAYVHDPFARRLNTVFKLGLQAWPLLALAASHAAALALCERRRFTAALALAGLAAGAPYLPLALATRLTAEPPVKSFDALADLAASAPGELAAIRHLAAHSPRGARVLCAPGESYRPESSRVPAASGRPTLLGWSGHEMQWRGRRWRELEANRPEVIEEIYREASGERLSLLLAHWRIDYVLLGPAERWRYALSAEREATLVAALPAVVSESGVRLLRVPGSAE